MCTQGSNLIRQIILTPSLSAFLNEIYLFLYTVVHGNKDYNDHGSNLVSVA